MEQLSIESGVFADLREQFDTMLNQTINNMMRKGTEEAALNIRLNIGLLEDSIAVDGGLKSVLRPTFSHEISSVMQVRERTKGSVKEDYELNLNNETGRWEISRLEQQQMCVFEMDDVRDEIAKTREEHEMFENLKQYVNDDMAITNNKHGEYELMDTTALPPVLIASSNPVNDRVIPLTAETLAQHEGHHLTCTGELTEDGLDYKSLGIVCEDCGEILFKTVREQ